MQPNPSPRRTSHVALALAGLIVLAALGVATKGRWLPLLHVDRLAEHSADDNSSVVPPDDHDHDDHDDHDHDDHDYDDHEHDDQGNGADGSPDRPATGSIKLSANGLKNIGFKPLVVEPSRFDKVLTLPAIVVERPGRSQLHITAPLSGVVTEIHLVTGEAVKPGQPLFEMRLMHEELVAAQRDYLRTAENLDVVDREIARLSTLGEGVVAGRRILEQQYEKQRLEASLHAESEAMLVHGISEEQIQEIQKTRRLLRSLVVHAPDHVHDDDDCIDDHLFQIQRLGVAQGEHLEAGRELAVLADHCELLVEGLAFEDDAPKIRRAAEAGNVVNAKLLVADSEDTAVNGMEILYVADQIAADSRAFKFYLRLPNRVVFDKTTPDGKRFIEWAYKPGQRMQLRLPIQSWADQLVVPTTAVVDEAAESYVYRQNGDSFHQVSVHVLHRDQESVVISNNGALFQGDVIAGIGAYQMHLTLKNQSGGGIDPHAGHNH